MRKIGGESGKRTQYICLSQPSQCSLEEFPTQNHLANPPGKENYGIKMTSLIQRITNLVPLLPMQSLLRTHQRTYRCQFLIYLSISHLLLMMTPSLPLNRNHLHPLQTKHETTTWKPRNQTHVHILAKKFCEISIYDLHVASLT